MAEQWRAVAVLPVWPLRLAQGVVGMNLRKLAKGRDCQVRLPGICNGNPETVVLAHPVAICCRSVFTIRDP